MTEFLVGRGSADITGEAAECGLLGYGKPEQQSAGIHQRLRARAFVVADDDQRVLLVVADMPLMFDSIHRAVLERLEQAFGDLYTVRNTMLQATHTHCGPGGYSHYRLYNSNTHGFRTKTFTALVDGIVEAAMKAHADLAPAEVSLAFGELTDASINRSRSSFDLNPAQDKAHFPLGIDPQVTLMRVERAGEMVAAITWFATHGTSMTNENRLIGGDNKGYAAYRWERVVAGVNYLEPTGSDLVAAFPQTNSGDMSPNLNQAPGSGPTEDEVENTRIIGTRQYDASSALLAAPTEPLTGLVDSRVVYVDMGDVTVRPEFTGDGKTHRTSGPIAGAASIAGTDEGKGFFGFKQGRNPFWDTITQQVYYRLNPALKDAQSPKGIVLSGGLLNRVKPLIPQTGPVQLIRLGSLYLIGIPAEVTIVAGLRLRQTVAAIVGAPLDHVLVAGYSNGYLHYVTTPEEYQNQRYEGGSTLFGRWELGAFCQIVSELATAMRDGKPVELGTPSPDVSAGLKLHVRPVVDAAPAGAALGDVLTAPAATYAPGAKVSVSFAGGYPNHDLQRGQSYLRVQQQTDGGWVTIADDSDWSTRFHWKRNGEGGSLITATWDVPVDAEAGTYRIHYSGHVSNASGVVRPLTGESPGFDVVPVLVPA